jgi:hypothetical protein
MLKKKIHSRLLVSITLINIFITLSIFSLLLVIPGVHAQELCRPIITKTDIVDASGYPQFDITIGGTIENGACSSVLVTLSCSSGGSATQEATVDSGTLKWSVLFENFDCPCSNGISSFSVVVECTEAEKCPGKDKRTFEYRCPEGMCPSINFVNKQIGPCTSDNATSCGYREVTFTPIITGTPTFYQWYFGDGTPNSNGSGLPDPVTHIYFKPPTFMPKLTLFTINCTPVDVVYPISGVNFEICDACPFDAQIVINTNSSGCHLTDNVSANFCEEQYNSFLIDYGDGVSETVMNLSQLNGFVIDHNYSADGTYDFSIALQKSGSNCTYTKEIIITNCGDDNDDCFFCFCANFWCCLLYILFILALFSTIVSLAVALCTGGTPAWVVFWSSLAAAVLLAILLITICDVGICEMFIALSIGGLINWAIICGTSLIPCNSWLCQMKTIPILGIQVQNFLIINLVIWLLTIILCAA